MNPGANVGLILDIDRLGTAGASVSSPAPSTRRSLQTQDDAAGEGESLSS